MQNANKLSLETSNMFGINMEVITIFILMEVSIWKPLNFPYIFLHIGL